jgi:hypothetical protein
MTAHSAIEGTLIRRGRAMALGGMAVTVATFLVLCSFIRWDMGWLGILAVAVIPVLASLGAVYAVSRPERHSSACTWLTWALVIEIGLVTLTALTGLAAFVPWFWFLVLAPPTSLAILMSRGGVAIARAGAELG